MDRTPIALDPVTSNAGAPPASVRNFRHLIQTGETPLPSGTS